LRRGLKIKYSIGIDIGGIMIGTGIVNQKGDLIQRVIVEIDTRDRERMFESVVHAVETLLSQSSIPFEQVYTIGAGVPGKIDHKQGIAVFQNNLPWRNFPFVERLQEVFPNKEIVIDNDVYMAAYAEWKAANLTDETFVYVTISTGISCSIISAGEFFRGAGFSGELGLIPVYTPHGAKEVGRLEQHASGQAIEKYGRQLMGDSSLTAKKVFEKYYDGDEKAKELMSYITSSIAHGLYAIVSLIDPHKIIIGGSVAAKNRILLHLVEEKLADLLIDEQKHILSNLEISTQDNNQGIIGAGLRAFHNSNSFVKKS